MDDKVAGAAHRITRSDVGDSRKGPISLPKTVEHSCERQREAYESCPEETGGVECRTEARGGESLWVGHRGEMGYSPRKALPHSLNKDDASPKGKNHIMRVLGLWAKEGRKHRKREREFLNKPRMTGRG